ncbi:amidohydrolase family protein [Streptomyces viridochromogenes]|uniref:amidohydrolase family protein n=1 Tax=Streptomyces viridochromogenes TaxID=1938 RepID=UPI00069D6810|nr:amidohydrolase family protein [Streptomyces viridochromogenes]KOG10013.1 amidohydrolase [Streptomyces viridochromogenes]KOG20874.1 amidohydrolase [Streptomyces viridochromogenes]
MDLADTSATSVTADARRSGPLSRRRFLQVTATATAAATATASVMGDTPAAAAASAATTLSFTAATGGSATLAPSGDRLVAEVQNVLWSLPRKGGTAVPVSAPGLEPTRPQFSPDGSRLVVCAYRGGGFHLWTLRPDGTGLRQLTDGPWDDRGPAWSPDGTRIAFASERGGDTVTGAPYRIWVVDVRTGAPTRLTGRPGQQGPGQDARWEDFDPAWSPDGERVLFVRAGVTATGTLRATTIASVAADGSGPVTVEYTDDSGAQLMTPAVSPAGRLAHLRTTAAPAASCTLVVDGEPVAVAGDVLPAPPRWTDTERLLLTVDGHFRLVDPDAPGDGEEIPFTATLPVNRPRYRGKAYDFEGAGARPVRALHLPALSPDGRSVAFAALNALWTAGTTGGRAPRKVLQVPATRYVSAPTWTPDGTALVYADDRDGLFAVRRRDLGSGAETVLAAGGRVFPALSPDGTRLACLDVSGNLVVRDLLDGAERVLAAPLGAGGLPGRPSWSPDGRYVALCDRNRLNQRFREGYNLIRVVDTTTRATALHALAPHTSLSDRYDSGPVWSPDGRWMAVIAESALWLLPVRADGTPHGAPRRLTTEPADHPSWSADARTLLYLSAGTLRLVDIRSGRTRTVRVPLDYRRTRPADTVVRAGRFWDGTGEDVREDIDVVIRDGRVAEVSAHRTGRPAAHRVDASESTVIPGLWDAHTHPWQTTYGGRQTALQLAYGITTAVSLGGFAYEQARIREAVAAGALAGPRLLTTGELLDGARVAYSMGRAHRTREGLRRSLARGAALDWDFVKTYVRAPGWVMKEAADFGHERLGVRSGSHLCSPGVQVGQDLTTHLQATQRLEFGHATSAAGRTYQDVVEIYTATDFHLVATPFTALALLGADPALADDPRVTALMPPWDTALVREGAGQPPTDAQLGTLAREMSVYRRILAGGGLVALGTDQPLVPVGLHLHLALRALHRAGLSPAEALRTATLLPARAFGAHADLGTVEEGKLADLTVVDGDPFTDFATLIRTTAVLRGGVLFEQMDLVDAFETDTGTASEWLEVSRRMRREGCCEV